MCSLCENRCRPVIFRGRIPADVLYVGEAPGDAENIQGVPFVPLAPAGSVIERILYETRGYPVVEKQPALNPSEFLAYLSDPTSQPETVVFPARYSWAITNTVACYPDGSPPEEAIAACSERLLQFKALVKPKLIVAVGKVADHAITKYGVNKQTKMTVVEHPTRMFIESAGDNDALELSIARAVMAIEEGLKWIGR